MGGWEAVDLLSRPVTSLLIKASLVLLAGLIVNSSLVRSTAGTRHLVWTATLAGVLVLPILALLMPTLELPWLPAKTPVNPVAEIGAAPPSSSVLPPAADGTERTNSWPAPAGATTPSAAATAASPTRPAEAGMRWQTSLIAIYILGVIVILAGPLVGIFRLWRIRRDVDVLSDGQRWRGVIQDIDSTPAVLRRVTVACSSAVPVPMTWGVLRPVVLFPLEAREWPADERRQALLHELSHVRRFDWFVQMMARLVCALYWFHPLVWLAKRRLHLEAERACDDNVLLAGARSSRYADQLLGLARRVNVPTLPTFGAVTLARRHQLWVRIDSILDHTVRRSPMTRTRTFAAALVTVVTLLIVGPLSVVPAGQNERETQNLNRSLMSAVARGDNDGARAMLDDGVDPDDGLRDRGTPLILAAGSGDMEMVRLLLSRGADVNHAVAGPLDPDEFYRTPLTSAARAGHLDVVRLLLDEGAHIDAAPPGDPTALMAAASGGHGEIVDLLIDRGADVNRVVVGDGSPLIAAARGGNSEITRRLLDEGADPNVTVRGDGSPLIAAARNGAPEAIELLLEHGADPNHWVNGDENALYHAIRAGDVGAVRTLIDAGVDVNESWPGDGTSLIVATRGGQEEIAEMLLAAGARPDKGVDGDGNALIMAAKRGDYDLVRSFIHAGADVNRGVRGDGNPLIMAARGGHLDVVQLLVDSGAEVDKVVRGDENALIQASAHGHLNVVQYLIAAGAGVNARVRADSEIRTPLSQATRNGHRDVVDLLRANGATE